MNNGAALTLTNCDVSNLTDLSGAHAGSFYAVSFVGYAAGTVNYDIGGENASRWDSSTGWPDIGGPTSGSGEATGSTETSASEAAGTQFLRKGTAAQMSIPSSGRRLAAARRQRQESAEA